MGNKRACHDFYGDKAMCSPFDEELKSHKQLELRDCLYLQAIDSALHGHTLKSR